MVPTDMLGRVTPQCMYSGMLPVPPQEFRRPSMYLPQAFPISLPAESGLHSHTPSSELWFAAVSGNPPGRSESPCPRTITGGGGGEQVGRLGASVGRGGEVGARLPISPFLDILVDRKRAPHLSQRYPGKGLGWALQEYTQLLPCRSYPSGSGAD